MMGGWGSLGMRLGIVALLLVSVGLCCSSAEPMYIDLTPVVVGSPFVNSSSHPPNDSNNDWVFMSVIMVPPLSCGSVAKVPILFDDGLLRANVGLETVRSVAQRLGSEKCVDGVCPCLDSIDKAGDPAERVLEIETRCSVDRLALPSEDEFLFVYDARTASPRRRKLMDPVYYHSNHSSFSEKNHILLRFVSVSSLTLASSSETS